MFARAKQVIRAAVIIAVTLSVLTFAVSNREEVTVTLFPLPYEVDMPKFLLIMTFFLLGTIVGGLLLSVHSFRLKRQLRQQEQRTAALENELASLQMRAPTPPAISLPAA